MAEVPEVEIITRDLRQAVVGRRFTGAEIWVPSVVRFPAPAAFVEALVGRQVTSASRRAKFILMPLDDGTVLALHFMLFGELALRPAGSERPSSTLVVLGLEGGEELQLTDTLGYARIALARGDELSTRLKLDELGPEALDEGFTPDVLALRLRRRKSPLKTVLLNQRVVAGLGNRDADESLWLAGVDPRRLATSLTPTESVRLTHAIRAVLDEGLRLRGTQRDLFGVQGLAKHRRNVFGRAGAPCPRCATVVAHERVGGRNTYWCPTCQPATARPELPAQSSLW
ncbi:Formamidopyrimidine-DNA glycosylase [Myxococcus hansupus]|uniref:Formamidopyrimidine-DNA glycosylase n=1 Tax=Pseudomyxococcus hansupus TaxID=1297742 RepID=A0A0H4WNI6_9BACT|nr:DNA-formamidopyrimidine glycosylase family protein [Myxococcus hansupus]AKQ64996.1 Formamidopyrimidine-DNA glycosylase [Myxococcus hansupus]